MFRAFLVCAALLLACSEARAQWPVYGGYYSPTVYYFPAAPYYTEPFYGIQRELRLQRWALEDAAFQREWGYRAQRW